MEPFQEAVEGLEDDRLIALLGGAWASINGEDVCPRHQTAAERADQARQIVSAIESQINRSAGLDPSPVEPGLVIFAMQLREALSSAQKSRSPQPSANASKGSSHIHLDVAITGAFLTGCPLRIGINEYESVQRKIATKLSERNDQGWMTSAEQLREGTYNSGGGFAEVLPLVLVCRDGADALARANAILRSRPKYEHDWLDSRIQGWRVKASSMRIEVYDLGVAVINGTFEVDVPVAIPLDAAARRLKEVVWLRPDGADKVSSPITEMFRQMSKETTRQFRAGVKDSGSDWPPQPWLPTTDPDGETSRDWGRLLWLHPVHMLASQNRQMRESSARELTPEFCKDVAVPDGRFFPGIGWSAIITTSKDLSTCNMPLKLLHLHWAYFALYMEIDRALMTVLDNDKSGTKRPLLPNLEKDAEEVFDNYIRVMKARARVDSALASLGGDEQAIWDVIADVQKFDTLVDGVDRKVEVLQKLADRRVQQATTASTRRTTRILGFLTSLTVVTLAVTLLGYFVGGLGDSPGENDRLHRIILLVVGVILAVTLWCWMTFGIRPWRRR
jgi:hypothetical protein